LGLLGLFSIPLLTILFSRSFIQASTFLPLQLSANYVQAAAWIVGAPLLGFGFVRTWMVIQLAGSGLRYVVTVLLSNWIGVHAVPAGLLIAVAFDLVADIIFCYAQLRILFDAAVIRRFVIGGGAILGCAVLGAASHALAVVALGAAGLCAIVAATSWQETQAGLRFAQAQLRRFVER
jgi:O-antigen/teichoic acid export membrane protein